MFLPLRKLAFEALGASGLGLEEEGGGQAVRPLGSTRTTGLWQLVSSEHGRIWESRNSLWAGDSCVGHCHPERDMMLGHGKGLNYSLLS